MCGGVSITAFRRLNHPHKLYTTVASGRFAGLERVGVCTGGKAAAWFRTGPLTVAAWFRTRSLTVGAWFRTHSLAVGVSRRRLRAG